MPTPTTPTDAKLSIKLASVFSSNGNIAFGDERWWYICTPTYSFSLILCYSCWMVFLLAFETGYHLPKGKSPSHLTRKRGGEFADDILVNMLKLNCAKAFSINAMWIESVCQAMSKNEKYMTLHFFRKSNELLESCRVHMCHFGFFFSHLRHTACVRDHWPWEMKIRCIKWNVKKFLLLTQRQTRKFVIFPQKICEEFESMSITCVDLKMKKTFYKQKQIENRNDFFPFRLFLKIILIYVSQRNWSIQFYIYHLLHSECNGGVVLFFHILWWYF